MRKKELQKLLADIEDIKVYECHIDKKLDQYMSELKNINSKLDRISQKFDEILKWSKYASQLWDRN